MLSIAKTVPGSQSWLLPGDFLPTGLVFELEVVIAQAGSLRIASSSSHMCFKSALAALLLK